jgi:methionine synthase I (cobalamin-dependent)
MIGTELNQSTDIIGRFRTGDLLFDGGIGTMLIARGLQPGLPPEEWNHTHPAEIKRVHAAYLEAGADVIETNTFGGTPSRMASFGFGEAAGKLNNTAIKLAREAVVDFDRHRELTDDSQHSRKSPLIALSIGPTGKMMPPVGAATDQDIAAEFRTQLESITEIVDIVLIETIFDIRESLLALQTAREVFPGPVAVTLTFNKNPRGFFTVMGNKAAETMKQLGDAGADVVGANCTLTSEDMKELARTLRESTDLPVLCQPNAGQPNIRDGIPVYDQTPDEYADDMIRLFDIGINAVGGCCGTTPEFIRKVFHRRRNHVRRFDNTKERS